MSDATLKVCGAAILCAALALILKRGGGDSLPLVKIAAVVVLGGACIVAMSPIINYIQSIADGALSGVSLSVASIIVKALCIAFISYMCASVCRECGEGGIASFVELAGKGEILLLSLDLIGEILSVAEKILDMGF